MSLIGCMGVAGVARDHHLHRRGKKYRPPTVPTFSDKVDLKGVLRWLCYDVVRAQEHSIDQGVLLREMVTTHSGCDSTEAIQH